MLAPLGLTLDDRAIVIAAFLAVAEGFAVQVAKRCADFHAAGGFDFGITHVNPADGTVVAIDGQRHAVVFQRFKIVDDIALIGLHPAA